MTKNKKEFSFFRKQIRKFGLKKYTYSFIENLAILLNAGVDLISALNIISEETGSKRMRTIIESIKYKIERGESLYSSLKEEAILPEHMLAFVKLGEDSGKLNANLNILVLYNKKEIAFRSKTRSALLYAVIVVFMSIAVALGTGWYTLPKIADAYGQFDSELPLLTKMIISFGEFLASYGYIVVPLGIFTVSVTFYFFFSFPKTRFVGHWLLMRVPLVKKLIIQVEVSRFSYLLGTMLDSGLPIKEGLKSMPDITTFKNYKKFYIHIYKNIEKGSSFKEAISAYPKAKKFFPATVRQMIVAGEKSGTLPETLQRLGKMYELKVDATARNLPVIIEPVLLIIIGVGVALFILGTIMPIYNLVNII